jgi:hypothetical protein
VGVRRRQDRELRGDGPDVRGLRRPTRLAASGAVALAGLLFFAFARYARIATLGEELIALTGAVTVYAVVAVVHRCDGRYLASWCTGSWERVQVDA